MFINLNREVVLNNFCKSQMLIVKRYILSCTYFSCTYSNSSSFGHFSLLAVQ